MYKKILSFTLITALLVSSAFIGVSADTAKAATNDIQNMTIEEAQAMALDNNLSYKSEDSYINDKLEAYTDTEDGNSAAASVATTSLIGYFNKYINLDISLQSAANNVKIERLKKANIKRTSDNTVVNDFINIKKAQYTLDDAKNSTSIKQKDYAAAQIKCNLGLITKDDLKVFEKAYTDAVTAEDSALKALQIKFQELNKLLGRELTNYNINPTVNLTALSLSDIDLNTIRTYNIKNDSTLYNLSLAADLAKQKYDATQERYDHFVVKLKVTNSSDDMAKARDNALRDYEIALKAFTDATVNLDISLNTTYNALKSSVDTVAQLQRDVADTKTDVTKFKLKYDLGLISKIDYEKKEISLTTLQNQLNTAIASQNAAYASLMMYTK